MKFTEKNNFIVKNKSERFFDKDLELFKVNCPNSTLHSNLKRVNSFNRSILDGKMLYELLDKVSPEEILNNRINKPAEQIIETVTSTDLSSSEQPPAETITEGKPEAVKTSKKKEVNKKSSRK